MKKKYFILNFVLLTFVSSLQAQVVNGNFEVVKPNFLPSNWGMNFLQQFAIDPNTGLSTGDNILYTWCIPSMVYATTEAQSGQYAMEISNAYNETQDIVIPGYVMIFSDETQDFPGWNPGVNLTPQANVQTLGFYYKFLAAGNDIAQATISVLDENGNEIGKTHIDLTGTNNQFHYIYSYVDYDSFATPAFMNITFSMAKPGSTPTFGSRLIVDNVVTNFQSLGVNTNHLHADFRIYPTLVDNEINVVPPSGTTGNINYKIINMQGRIVKENNEDRAENYVYKMELSDLSPGVYMMQIESNAEKITKKFIKR